MSRIRVLEMIDQPFLGGGQINLVSLVKALDPGEFECTVCSRDGGPLVDVVREAGIPHIPVSFRKRPDRKVVRDVRALLDRIRPHILHTHGGVAGLYGRWAVRRRSETLLVHTLHGIHYLHYRNRALRMAMIHLERRLSRRTAAVICVSDEDLVTARRLRLAHDSRLTLIKNGIDILAAPSPDEGRELRRRLAKELEDDLSGPVVGTIARLHRQKGLPYLLEAAEAVRERFPKARFLIIGGGPLAEKLRKLNRSRGGEGVVHLLGQRTDAVPLLSLFDIFVLPSLWEGLPYALMEAAAFGKPVVASDVEGNRELISHGRTGWLAPAADSAALAEGIIHLLSEPEEAARLGRNLYRLVSREYTLQGMVDRTAALYRRLHGASARLD